MNNYIRGMMLGSLVGLATSAMLIEAVEPRVGRNLMRKGKAVARHYKKRLMNMDMF